MKEFQPGQILLDPRIEKQLFLVGEVPPTTRFYVLDLVDSETFSQPKVPYTRDFVIEPEEWVGETSPRVR